MAWAVRVYGREDVPDVHVPKRLAASLTVLRYGIEKDNWASSIVIAT